MRWLEADRAVCHCSLNPEFLEPAMHEVMTELMMALWSHLRPSPIQFGKKVRRTLANTPNHAIFSTLKCCG